MLANYSQIEEYVLNIPKFRPEGNIEQTRKFYEFLGKPGSSASIIHVAGTNGKGSTCAYMNSVLTEAGVKTGMFTSPHLVSVRERMRVNQELISEVDFIAVYEQLKNRVEKYNKLLDHVENYKQYSEEYSDKITEEITEKKTEYIPTFYEFLFFMAMLYFEEQKTEVIILETGLGGRLDATNVIDAPKVAVITEIGMDHMEYLGDTYEKIAKEKAGIIKNGSKIIYCANRQEVAKVMEERAKECQVLCKCVEKCEKHAVRFVDKKIDFSYQSRYYGYIPITVRTCAFYQVENATLALSALEELDIEISLEAIQKGMEACKWEGRMEEILPNVYLDGAHNQDGITAFVETVKEDGCQGKRWLLFSAVADKEYENMKEALMESALFDYVYAAPLKIARGITKDNLEKIFSANPQEKGIRKEKLTEHKIEYVFRDYEVRIVDRACEGLEEIMSLKKAEDYVYVTGSLYLVGEIKGTM